MGSGTSCLLRACIPPRPVRPKYIFGSIDPSKHDVGVAAFNLLTKIKEDAKCPPTGCKHPHDKDPEPCKCWKPLKNHEVIKTLTEGCDIMFDFTGHCGAISLKFFPKSGGTFVFSRYWLLPLHLIHAYGHGALITVRVLNDHHRARFLRLLGSFAYMGVSPLGIKHRKHDLPGIDGLAIFVHTRYRDSEIITDKRVKLFADPQCNSGEEKPNWPDTVLCYESEQRELFKPSTKIEYRKREREAAEQWTNYRNAHERVFGLQDRQRELEDYIEIEENPVLRAELKVELIAVNEEIRLKEEEEQANMTTYGTGSRGKSARANRKFTR